MGWRGAWRFQNLRLIRDDEFLYSATLLALHGQGTFQFLRLRLFLVFFLAGLDDPMLLRISRVRDVLRVFRRILRFFQFLRLGPLRLFCLFCLDLCL